MGTGKSTVAPRVARRLGWAAVDLDAEVERLAGRPVARIFAEEGEAGFRRWERRALEAVLERVRAEPLVLALGGGTLHAGDNAERLRRGFDVVVLDAPWSVLRERVGDRPLAGRAEALHAARREGYRRAGPRVEVAGRDPEAVAEAVIAAWRGRACA